MGLDYMLEAFPLQEVINKVFTGIRRMRQGRLDLPRHLDAGWTLAWYVGLAFAAVRAGFRRVSFLER